MGPAGSRGSARRDAGGFLREHFPPEPRSASVPVPGLASVPRSHRHLGPAAPAHVGPEAGGARGALCVTPQLPRAVSAGAALCRPVVHAGLPPVGARAPETLSRRRPDLHPPALAAPAWGLFQGPHVPPKAETVPGSALAQGLPGAASGRKRLDSWVHLSRALRFCESVTLGCPPGGGLIPEGFGSERARCPSVTAAVLHSVTHVHLVFLKSSVTFPC